jgi:transcription elongation GreA/GreB family factor
MSRAFVKEGDDGARVEQLPDRPQSPHINYVTAEGLRALQGCVAELSARRAELLLDDSLQSRQAQSVIERDLRYFEQRLQRAILVERPRVRDGRVHFGDTVRVIDSAGVTSRFAIVGEDEADAPRGKISWVSPLATALMNSAVADHVVWRRPAGDVGLEVVGIESAEEV